MSSAVIDPTAPPGEAWLGHDMKGVFAPFYWGCVASFVLTGITILQAWNYLPGRDKLFIRLMAWAMVILDIVSSILSAQGMYMYLIPNFGSFVPLAGLNKYISAECFLAVTIVFMSVRLSFEPLVQTTTSERASTYSYFHIDPIFTLPGKFGPGHRSVGLKYVVTGSILFFAFVAFVAGLMCSSYMIIDNAHVLTERSLRLEIVVGVSKGAALFADLIATVALCLYLANARTGFKGTDSMIKRLMGYIIQRGLLVTAVQITFVVLFFMSRTRLEWLAFHVNMTKVYANTFFAMLNAREAARGNGPQSGFSDTGGSHSSGSKVAYEDSDSPTLSKQHDLQGHPDRLVQIDMQTSVVSDRDSDLSG
ncbi:hypothetical protein BDV98DRAFT_606476 [Pterulicium gracile]|uniref:DUF6534 domain-containing protein n=1 Tax=Pterulicium gracile TaxID=1884261 RepID=A0A5C3QBR2_9AGAR|nr:hypothetical protein BDV98DRAFT_606476 [Pterula gracilis]